MLAAALLLLAVPASAESMVDRLERDYVRPALDEVGKAFQGSEPSWTPPMPGMPQVKALIDDLRAKWIEPLLESDQAYSVAAAQALASARLDDGPPDPAPVFADLPFFPAAAGAVETVMTRFVEHILPGEYASQAAQALGSKDPDASGPAEPDMSRLPEMSHVLGDIGQGVRAPDAGAPRAGGIPKGLRHRRHAGKAAAPPPVDSTSMVRGHAGALGSFGTPRPKLKPVRSHFSYQP